MMGTFKHTVTSREADFQTTTEMPILRGVNVSAQRSIYGSGHRGAVVLPQAIHPDFLSLLRSELTTLDSAALKRAPSTEGQVKQNYFSLYLGAAEDSSRNPIGIRMDDLPMCMELAKAYVETVYNPMAALVDFDRMEFPNSIGIHKYEAQTGYIEYHRDYSCDTNLIAMFTAIGSATFGLADSRDGGNEVAHNVEAGDLVLMRAPRNKSSSEHTQRPFHRVHAFDTRWSILFRNREPL